MPEKSKNPTSKNPTNHTPSIFPKFFTKCPLCGANESVARVAKREWEATGKISKEQKVYTRRELVPLLPEATATQIFTVRLSMGLLKDYDVCLICGYEYIQRIDATPITLTPSGVSPAPQRHPPPGAM